MTIRDDAELFSRFQHGGNWSIALLVVRSVEPGPLGAGPRWKRDPEKKVSFHEFGRLANCSPHTVSRWYYQWERAAEMLVVPHATVIEPGMDIPLPCEACDDPKHYWRNYSERRAGHPTLHTPKRVALTRPKLHVVDEKKQLVELLEDIKALALLVIEYDEFPRDRRTEFAQNICTIVSSIEDDLEV